MAPTGQAEEQRWRTQRWLNEETRWIPSTRSAETRSDESEFDRRRQRGDESDENICKPTLEKLYAAQRKQKRDLARQIDEAMRASPE